MMENPERVTYFAATDSRGKRVPFGIKTRDRERHMYVIGKTGMGKSTMLENLAIQDIRNGEGLAFIDPHGSAVEKLLDYIPPERIDDVVYFAPFDLDQPIAFNVMEDVGYDKRHLVVSGLMATFKKIWVDAWSARMEYILTNTLLALLEYPGATLLGVNRMYTDKTYRKRVVDNIKDPVVKDFWVKEFAGYTDKFTAEATPAIQNKIGQFTSNPLIRNIIGQSKSSFDIRTLMDNRKILLINLSKGQVGDTNMKLLGSMITTRIFLAAMSRAELHAAEMAQMPRFYFYVDEFQNFANDTFAEILSEARKYKLALTIAHQYIEQMEEQVAAAVFGNVGTTVSFRVGPFDAEKLEVVFSPEFMKEDLVNLGFAQIYLSLMINGVGSRPFSAVTIPSIEPPQVNNREAVIAASRQTYGNKRVGIEEQIFTELAETASDEPAVPKPRKGPAGSGYQGSRPNAAATGGSAGGPSRAPTHSPAPQQQDRPAPEKPAERPYQSPGAPQPGRPAAGQNPAFGGPQEGSREGAQSAPPRNRPPQGSHQVPPQGSQGSQGSQGRPPARPVDRPARPNDRPAPPAAGKSAEDLKAILRTMTAGVQKEQAKKVEAKQGSVKSALADVLAKSGVQIDVTPPAPSAPSQPKPFPPRAPETNPERELPPPPVPRPVPQGPQPFEVPEDKLRAIFKENL